MEMMIRKQTFIPFKDEGCLFVSKDQRSENSPYSILLLHGLTGDQIGPGKLLANLCLHLSKHFEDTAFYRFDFRGSGLSSGNFSNTSFDSMLEDAIFVESQIQNCIAIIGLSTGSIVALALAQKLKKNQSVIAISQGFFPPIEAIDKTNQLISIREGQHFICPNFFIQKNNLPLPSWLRSQKSNLSILLGGSDGRHLECIPILESLGIYPEVIDQADHLFNDPKARFNLFNTIVKKVYEIRSSNSLSHR
jgi:pimeloyl-ACP methyl ester carboxylesterase